MQSGATEPFRRAALLEIRRMLDDSCLNEGTSGSSSWRDYIRSLGRAKVVVTTNYLQSFFIKGPSIYRERLVKTTTTGRVWDAFGAGCALICNRTEVLENLGFVPGIHYLDLDELLNSPDTRLRLQDDTFLEHVAKAGSSRFAEVIEGECRTSTIG